LILKWARLSETTYDWDFALPECDGCIDEDQKVKILKGQKVSKQNDESVAFFFPIPVNKIYLKDVTLRDNHVGIALFCHLPHAVHFSFILDALPVNVKLLAAKAANLSPVESLGHGLFNIEE